MEEKLSQLSDILWEHGLLEDRDYTLVNGEAHNVKIYRGDLDDLLSQVKELDSRLIRIDASDPEDEQMDVLSVQIFLKG